MHKGHGKRATKMADVQNIWRGREHMNSSWTEAKNLVNIC